MENFLPKGIPDFLSISLGPDVPEHPPITLEQIIKNLFVSIGLFGPTIRDHQPSFFVIGLNPLTY